MRFREVERAPNDSHGPFGYEDLARRRRLLEPRRDVDRVTRDERAPDAGRADRDLPGVDTDAQRQLVVEQCGKLTLHGKSRMQRTLAMILLRGTCPEGHENCVARELLHRPTRGLGFVRHRPVEAVEQCSHALGVLVRRERSRANEVGEEDRYEFPLLCRRWLNRRGTCRTEAGGLGECGST